MVFITWEAPLSSFFKVKFNDNVIDSGNRDGLGFVIKDSDSGFIVVCKSLIFDTSILEVESRKA